MFTNNVALVKKPPYSTHSTNVLTDSVTKWNILLTRAHIYNALIRGHTSGYHIYFSYRIFQNIYSNCTYYLTMHISLRKLLCRSCIIFCILNHLQVFVYLYHVLLHKSKCFDIYIFYFLIQFTIISTIVLCMITFKYEI